MWTQAGAGVLVAVLTATAAPVSARMTGHPRRHVIDALIVHSLGGPDCQDGRTFYKQIAGDAASWAKTFASLPIVSIHYVIGRDGVVVSGIPEAIAASHAIGWNQRSIGIELVNNGDDHDPFPQVQVDALITLARALRRRYPQITLERVLRHSDVDHSTFPADVHGQACTAYRRKLDPGDAFPWEAFKAAIARHE